MEPISTIAGILSILKVSIGLVKEGYTLYQQVSGDIPIPTLAELLEDNDSLQKLIDAEKERLGI